MTGRTLALAVLTGAALTACDYPTEPPLLEQTWVVPGETIDVSVVELLPATVDVNADTTAFLAEVPETSALFSLGALCGAACPVAGSYPVSEKPAFADTVGATASLPGDVVSATLAPGGSVDVVLAHDFDFDPLRPNPSDPDGATGTLGITIRSGGNVVADTTISGETQAFPGGTILTPALALRPVTVADGLEIEVRIASPAGETTTIETSDTLGVTVQRTTVAIAEVTVQASSVTIDPVTASLDFAGIEQGGVVVESIQSGALRLDVHNPFAVEGTMDVTFDLPAQTIQRSLAVRAPVDGSADYEERIELSGDELRSIFGADQVDIVTSGTVSAPDGTVTVRPDQELVVESAFEVVTLVGGSEDA